MMPTPITTDTKTMCGVTLRRDPAREPCFTVAQHPREMHDYGDMSPAGRRERLHRHMHNEMQNLEIAAQSLREFPDAPWELRLQLARQCWDETRHTQVVYRRLREIGGHKGEFPVMNYEYGVTCACGSLVGRLAIQNRTFESGEMDLLRDLAQKWDAVGDPATAEMLRSILADEVQHVRFGNQWIKKMARDNPRSVLDVATAMRHLRTVTAALVPEPGDVSALGQPLGGWEHDATFTNVEDRRAAGFTEEELAALMQPEGNA
jgi:uncharacterized ferritin-like protein (DUF455 family)